jgi:hypothetical protein
VRAKAMANWGGKAKFQLAKGKQRQSREVDSVYELLNFVNFAPRFRTFFSHTQPPAVFSEMKFLPIKQPILVLNLKSWRKTAKIPGCHEVMSAIIII